MDCVVLDLGDDDERDARDDRAPEDVERLLLELVGRETDEDADDQAGHVDRGGHWVGEGRGGGKVRREWGDERKREDEGRGTDLVEVLCRMAEVETVADEGD